MVSVANAATSSRTLSGFERAKPLTSAPGRSADDIRRSFSHVRNGQKQSGEPSTGDRYPPLNLTPQKRKEKTLRALLAQLEGLAAHQPVLMVFEDVHWNDPTSRELLDLIVNRLPALAVLLIITFRPELAPPWMGRPQVTLLSLSRLPPRGETSPRNFGGSSISRRRTLRGGHPRASIRVRRGDNHANNMTQKAGIRLTPV